MNHEKSWIIAFIWFWYFCSVESPIRLFSGSYRGSFFLIWFIFIRVHKSFYSDRSILGSIKILIYKITVLSSKASSNKKASFGQKMIWFWTPNPNQLTGAVVHNLDFSSNGLIESDNTVRLEILVGCAQLCLIVVQCLSQLFHGDPGFGRQK